MIGLHKSIKNILLLWVSCQLVICATAQKNDYVWRMGFGGISNTISVFSSDIVDFNTAPPTVSNQFRPISILEGGGSVSDKSGMLQFYSNGFAIYNRNDQEMPNGAGLNPGAIADDYNTYPSSCYPANHSCLAIPKPQDDSLFYLFHVGWEYGTTNSVYCNYLYYTTVDARLNGGLGDVVDKNHPLIQDILIGGSGMAACKHANGRDWWIIMQQMFSNCFYEYLLTPYGIDTMGIQCIGDSAHFDLGRGSSLFTPDGTKYIWSNPYEHLNILDFDRCSGEFNRYRRLPVIDSLPRVQNDGSVYLDGVAVSPGSRYLYLSTISEVRQFDLTANDIAQSEMIVANTYTDTPYTSVCFSQLAPNGKIYLVPFQQDTFLHVINYPDSAGTACNFVKNALRLPGYNHTYLPNYPNYRLGPLNNSPCDSLLHTDVKDIDNQAKLYLYPNPATDFVTIDYGFTDWNKGGINLEITNELGQLVHQQPLPMYSGFQKIDVSNFPSGFYTTYIKRNNQIVAIKKFAKQ